ncbi:AlpA family transcriptional regulator [Variovorax sp. RO1]|nr:AlpA family transcriptional regulator [Variovorax sp. RO1]
MLFDAFASVSIESIAMLMGSTGLIERFSNYFHEEPAVAQELQALLRKKRVLELTGLSNSTFYALIRNGLIKPGVPVGSRIKAWPESEVQAFIDSCITARDTGGAR